MTTETIPLEFEGGHVLLNLGGVRTFLDTGSQFSFGDVPSLRLLGRDHPIQPDLLGQATIASLRSGLQSHTPLPRSAVFDALVGLDVLRGTTLEFNWSAKELRVTASSQHSNGSAVPHLPMGTIEVNGKTVTAALDTGAWRSYLVPELAEEVPRTGAFEDYNPILGVLRPELVRTRTVFLGQEQTLDLGVAPPRLAELIRTMGASVLVGNDLMSHVPRLTMEIF
ncbi:pepsin/retropepsin-like aspartic protease family protein [Anaeromyxobacter paludicola]|uniref:Aspartyl protease n=1 Tax=Anaeromyxobacter paludicola TaxID=2918171 RepID=A0ABM7X9S8_9BACT|nr:hypothetical protein [Anaeromyxobacter paludicola]BDG08601.1 hypothetical protein AMPC_17140 [Anaeromyxobacter paludicola]